jgi:hypothetical protein
MICALCKLDRQLRNSHVVPEFFYKPVYDEKHRTQLLSGDGSCRVLQKGLRKRLLCGDCEQLIQEFEDYFARYWYQGHPIPERVEDNEVLLKGVDYRRVKLLLLSIAWRASVSGLPVFASARLGPHEESIRNMIFKGDPRTSEDYRVYVGLIIDPQTHALWDKIILLPLRIRVDGHWASRMVFGGASWTVITSGHQMPRLHGRVLTETGELRLPLITWPDFARAAGLVEVTQKVKAGG